MNLQMERDFHGLLRKDSLQVALGAAPPEACRPTPPAGGEASGCGYRRETRPARRACDMTTRALLCPTPGSASSGSNVSGTAPPGSLDQELRDSALMAFALGGLPGRTSSIRPENVPARESFRPIARGVAARRRTSAGASPGFTPRPSVHCAESTTAKPAGCENGNQR
jgi:hypothetical protein